MKRLLLGMSVVVAMLLSVSPAVAAGINIAWTNCFGEGTGLRNKTFACNVNSGSHALVTSFVLGADIPQVSGNELVIDVLTTSDPVPAWWEFKDAGTCRSTSLSVNFTANINDVVCVDWAAGQSSGGIGAYSTELGSINSGLSGQHRRIKIAVAVPQAGLANLIANTEYFSCNVIINNAKTVGTVSCPGCPEPVCIVFNSLNVTTPVPSNDVMLGNSQSAGSNIVTWQGVGPNCLAVPTRNVTWGAVKSLYR